MERKILKFSAIWCGPCKQLGSLLQGVDLGIPVENIDAGQDSKSVTDFKVRTLPTLILIENGIEVSRITGLTTVDKIKETFNLGD